MTQNPQSLAELLASVKAEAEIYDEDPAHLIELVKSAYELGQQDMKLAMLTGYAESNSKPSSDQELQDAAKLLQYHV